VFPNAPLKVFLTASDEERARRRHQDEAASARTVGVDAVRADMARRDAHDSGRATSPLRQADDAIVIDTTSRDVDDIVGELVDRARAVGVA
jgi:cytidylate kinase